AGGGQRLRGPAGGAGAASRPGRPRSRPSRRWRGGGPERAARRPANPRRPRPGLHLQADARGRPGAPGRGQRDLLQGRGGGGLPAQGPRLPVEPSGGGSMSVTAADEWVLVVDDNVAGRYAVSRMLRRGGYAVREAGTGREALALAAERPRLVLLDV